MNSKDLIPSDFYRWDLINNLIQIYNYKSFLEIGTHSGHNFKLINCEKKYCVDPEKLFDGLTHHMTSDEFFSINNETYDIIFIDGLHQKDQVIKDVENSLKILNKCGTIVMHDCLPQTEYEQTPYHHPGNWTGDVWKAFAFYRNYPDLFMMTLDTDAGLGVIKKGEQNIFNTPENIDWNFFVNHKKDLMNIKYPYEGLDILKKLQKNGF